MYNNFGGGIKFDNVADLDPDPSGESAGDAAMRLTWAAPAKGVASGYEWEIQQLTTSNTGARTLGRSDRGAPPTDLGSTTNVSATCASGSTTCFVRVRAYDSRAGDPHAYGEWITVNDQPWAPYSLGGGSGRDLTASRAAGGIITIAVSEPRESGPGTSAGKSYAVQACDEVLAPGCTLNSDWTTVSSGALAYPGTETTDIDVSTPCPDDADACSVRVRLVDVVATATGAFKAGTYKGIWSVKETASGL